MVIPCYTPLPTQECWLLEHLEGAKGLFWTHWLRPTAGFLLELNPLDAEDDVPWMSRARMEAFCMPNTGITGTVSSMFFSFFFWLPICSIFVQSFRGTATLHHRRSWFCFCPRSANHCQRFLGLHGMPCGWNDNSSRNGRSGRRNQAPSKVNRWWSPQHVDRRANKLIKKPTMGMGQNHSKPSILPDLNIHYPLVI